VSDVTETSQTVAAGKLRAFIERIERIEAEIKDLNADKSEIYKELRGEGFDVKAVRQCVAARKLDTAEREERTAIFDLYWAALNGVSRVHVHEAASYAEATGREPTVSKIEKVQPQGAEIVNPQPSAKPAPAESMGGTISATIPDDDVPAFIKRDRKPLRPNCLNPDLCAGSGRDHCHACKKAMAEAEAA
jgi:uncharacterized protein (UPF0335 family)